MKKGKVKKLKINYTCKNCGYDSVPLSKWPSVGYVRHCPKCEKVQQ